MRLGLGLVLAVVPVLMAVCWVAEAVRVILRVMAQYRACPGICKGIVWQADWCQDGRGWEGCCGVGNVGIHVR